MPVPVERSPFERAVNEGLTAVVSRPPAKEWIEPFLSAVMQGASVKDAVKQVGIHLSLPYKTRLTDEAFKTAWTEATVIGTESLEQEAARRAYHGTLEPVFYKGVECGQIRKYSDLLMIFLLKGRKPEMYREGVEDVGQRPTAINIQVVQVESKPPPLSVIPQESGPASILVEVVPNGNGTNRVH